MGNENATSQAADSIKKLANKFERDYRPMVLAAEILDSIGSFEQAEFEAKARMDEAISETENQNNKLIATKIDIEAAQSKAKMIVEQANLASDEILNRARDTAEIIFVDAKHEGESIIVDAERSTSKRMSSCKIKEEEINLLVEQKKEELKRVSFDVTGTAEKLAFLRSELETIKTKIRNFV